MITHLESYVSNETIWFKCTIEPSWQQSGSGVLEVKIEQRQVTLQPPDLWLQATNVWQTNERSAQLRWPSATHFRHNPSTLPRAVHHVSVPLGDLERGRGTEWECNYGMDGREQRWTEKCAAQQILRHRSLVFRRPLTLSVQTTSPMATVSPKSLNSYIQYRTSMSSQDPLPLLKITLSTGLLFLQFMILMLFPLQWPNYMKCEIGLRKP